MRARSAFALAFALVFAPASIGCATISAKGAFNKGEKAREKGELDEAIKNYEQAAAADPKNPKYQSALDGARKEALDQRVLAARQAEERGDFPAAAKHWEEAQRYSPGNAELSARKDIALLKTKRADPVEFYEAAKKLAAALPQDQTAQKALKDAKDAAVAYHVRLADTYAEAKSYERAHAEFEIAKKIDPNHPVFKGAAYRQSEARYLEAEGDAKVKAGDMLGAYSAYEKAAAISSNADLETKMRRAKRGAGALVEQLEQAAAFENMKQWEDAAEIYTVIATRQGAPQDIAQRAARARKESAKIRADRAKAYADRGLVDKAAAELTLCLEHTDAPPETLKLLQGGVEALGSKMPGDAKAKIERAKESAPDLAIVAVAPAIVLAAAQTGYEEAKKEAESSPADALIALKRLEPFADKLKGYTETRDKLVKKAFGALLESAEKRSAEGRPDLAAELIATALEFSKPPKDIADHLKSGTQSLVKRDWDGARDNFDKALAITAKSNLARVGRKVAVDARLADLRREASDAREAEDTLRAATAYQAILQIDPNDAEAKAGTEELRGQLLAAALESAHENEAAGKTGAAFLYYKRVLDLDPTHLEAKAALGALSKNLHVSAEPVGYVEAAIRGNMLGDSCPGAEKDLRDRLVLYLNKTRKLGAEYMTREDTAAVDEKKKPAPPVVLRTALEACDPKAQGGSATLSVQLLFAGEVIGQDRVVVQFDPTGIPKDELADGLSPKRVEKMILGEAAKAVTNAIKPHGAKLADWRAKEAAASIKANDGEAAARAYAALSSTKDLSESERAALRNLERFLLNRFR